MKPEQWPPFGAQSPCKNCKAGEQEGHVDLMFHVVKGKCGGGDPEDFYFKQDEILSALSNPAIAISFLFWAAISEDVTSAHEIIYWAKDPDLVILDSDRCAKHEPAAFVGTTADEVVAYALGQSIHLMVEGRFKRPIGVVHWAIEEGYPELLRLALAHGVSADTISWDGMTALHSAIYHSDDLATAALLDMGASWASKDKHDRTPFDIARDLWDPDDRSRIWRNRAQKVIQHLLSKYRCTPFTCRDGQTLLHLACYFQHSQLVAQLLDKEDEFHNPFNTANQFANDTTPLHEAARSGGGSENVVKVLLANGANPISENGSGVTPLRMLAYRRKNTGVKALLHNAVDQWVEKGL